jgi:hypothetical protein
MPACLLACLLAVSSNAAGLLQVTAAAVQLQSVAPHSVIELGMVVGASCRGIAWKRSRESGQVVSKLGEGQDVGQVMSATVSKLVEGPGV